MGLIVSSINGVREIRVQRFSTTLNVMEGDEEHRYMNIENRLKITRLHPNFSEEYIGFVDYFLLKAFARESSVLCPCKHCLNQEQTSVLDDIRLHLLRNGFDRNYDVWTFHGEIRARGESRDGDESKGKCKMDAMFDNVMRDFDGKPEILESFVGEKCRMLYPGCKESDTVISCLMEIFNIKEASSWNDSSVNALLKFLHNKLLEGNEMPDNLYEAKKILCPMGLEYEKINACPNYCVLFRGKKLEEMDHCPVCKDSRYKKIVKKME